MGGLLALLSMLGGTAMTMKANSDAGKKQQRAIAESQARQREFQRQAERKTLDTAETFDSGKRQQDQQQIAQQVEQELIQPVAQTQAANDINSRASGNVSKDYDTAKVASNLTQMKNAEALARLLGKTTSASRLRQNEAVRVGNAAMDVDRINNFADRQAKADELGIASAGVPNGWMQLGGGLLSNAGNMGLRAGGMDSIGKLFGKAPINPINSEAVAANFGKTAWQAPIGQNQQAAATFGKKAWSAPIG